jgi:hypothetical protein
MTFSLPGYDSWKLASPPECCPCGCDECPEDCECQCCEEEDDGDPDAAYDLAREDRYFGV